MNKVYPLRRIDKSFENELNEIIKERMIKGKDNPSKPMTLRVLTKAMPKASKWKEIKNILIEADIKDDRWIQE